MDAPACLKALNQWIVWRDEAGRKVPYQPSGDKAKTNDSTTWHTWEACQCAGFSGPGFVFAESDPFCGIDLDGCYDDGQIAPWASEVLDLFTGRYYAEVSPSGRGIKLWVRARLPDGRGRKHSIPGKPGQGVEIYDRGRYFTFTGQSMADLEIDDAQAAVDRLLAWYFPPRQPGYASPVHCSQGGDIGRRVAAYMAKVPPAVSGSDGHGQTIRAAAILIRGFCLEPDRAFAHLAAWNERCEPPWSEHELWHKINDAAKHEGERGWLLNGNRYNGPDVDLSRLLESITDEPIVADVGPINPLQFPTHCLEPAGLLGEIVRYNLRTAMWPQPELALGAAIALMGVVTGRKIRDSHKTRTNVYVLGLAPSGAGKEHARKINKDILDRAGDNGRRMLGPERIASSAGLVKAVDVQPAVLFQLDEIGRLLETMRDPRKAPHLYNIGSVLMSLESSSDARWIGDAYADVKKTPTIDQPHACLYGTAVPEGFWEALTVANVGEGFLGRLLVFESGVRYPDRHRPADETPPASIVDRVRWWVDFQPTQSNLVDQHPEPLTMTYEAAAQARMDAHLDGIRKRLEAEDNATAALWMRTGGKTARLALIHAASRQTGAAKMTVSESDVSWAIAVSNWLTRRMLYQAAGHVAANEWERCVKRVLRVIRQPMSRNELTRKTQWLRSRERDEILSSLIESGQIVIEQVTTATKPATRIRRRTP